MDKTDTILFGKYQICRELGRGRSGTVYLAKHLDLEEYRAIKEVSKDLVDYEQFRKEALILKSIRHPGIPIVYDLIQEHDFFYIVEEFLSGETLYALISGKGRFQTAKTIQYGIQICHLVSIMHSARPTPILYLDLQPKNLLLCNDTVKLIDFDHAIHLSEAEHLEEKYGTAGFAAPEQYTDEAADERTDIYAIGAVLFYMLTGVFPGGKPAVNLSWNDKKLMRIIRTCLQEKKSRRFGNVSELLVELQKLEKEKQGKKGDGQISSLIIALVGSHHGVGVTHVAMGLTAYLTECGILSIYEERNDSDAVRQMAVCKEASVDQNGNYRIGKIIMRPLYGETVSTEKFSLDCYTYIIRDYGIDKEVFLQEPADVQILVCGSKPWEWETTKTAVLSLAFLPGLAVIYNQFCGAIAGRLPIPARETLCFRMPHCPNPLVHTRNIKRFYQLLIKKLTR